MMITLKIDPSRRYQTILGFGASGCWWASNWQLHGWPFAWLEETIALLYDDKAGIGLNTYRHNIGSGSRGGSIPPIRETRAIEAAPLVFDLALDAENQRILDLVTSWPRVDRLTLFINSPPGRMTVTGEPNGNPDWATNLKAECTDDFIEYAARAAKAYVDAGYPVTCLSPVNEPQWDWHAGVQEGTFYSVDQVMTICAGVAEQLEALCPQVQLSMPDSARWDHEYMYEIIRRLRNMPSLLNRIDHLAAHSYQATAQGRQRVMDALTEAQLPISMHQTEWCEEDQPILDSMDCALVLARTLHEDLTILNTPVWEFWKAVETNPDFCQRGLVLLPLKGEWEGPRMTKRGWVLGQYARFVTGAQRIHLVRNDASEGVYGSVYEKAEQLILVLTNETNRQQLIALEGLEHHRAQVYCTDETRDLADLGKQPLDAGFRLPEKSVVTLLVSSL